MKTKIISLLAQLFIYMAALILIIQILRAIFGGTWKIEDIILALLILNITATFTIVGYVIHLGNKIYGHIEWHKGRDSTK